jgi:RHS repeat-associated protein
MTWDCNGAVQTSQTDENTQTTNFQHNDPFWRLTATGYPDGGSKTIYYTSPNLLDVYTALNSSTTRHDQTSLDSLGRVNAQSLLGTNNSVISEVDTTYDALGRVYSVSNPHAGTSSPSDGITYYSYDALGRLSDEGTANTGKSIVRPDGNTVSTVYSANCVTLTDEQSKVRKNCYDALGHLKQVYEDPNGSNFLTSYSYDTLGDLTGVSQNSGQQTRTYYYDAFSRLTRAVTPEAAYNSTYFYYTTSGGALCSGDPNAACRRTDARSITTTYTYDTANRLTSKTYSDGTPAANFFYDQPPSSWPAWSGVTFGYPKGRLILACTNSPTGTCTSPQTAVAYSYDKMGRPANYWQCTPYNCGSASIWSMPYTYDLAGDVHTWTHPAGSPTITNSIIDVAQRITQISSNLVDSTHPGNLAQTITYTPWGAVHTFENGCAGSGCTNIRETDTYNNRLQPVMIELQKTSDNSHNYCLVYNYYSGFGNPTGCAVPSQATTGNNGNVAGYWYNDNVSSSQTHTAAYAYDNVNRLGTAVATGNSTYNLTFSYDRYGNMTCQLNGQTNGPCPNWTFNSGTNRITTSGFTYDAAGNLTGDGTYTYEWDAEGRLKSVNSGALRSFIYNALGRQAEWHGDGRVSEVLTDLAGHVVGSVNSGGGWESQRIPGGGMELAWYVNGGTTFPHYNALGSTVMNTRHDGTVTNDILFYPWGQGWAAPVNDYIQFFGSIPNWDWEIGEGVTPNRYYPNNQGRWLSPDPLAGNISNPQSLNRYAYVLNNPTTLTDPTGLQGEGGHCGQSTSPRLCAGQYYGHWDSGSLFGLLWDEFDLMGIPVVAYGYGWTTVHMNSYPGPSWSGPGFSATSTLNIKAYWGPISLGYQGDAFIFFTQIPTVVGIKAPNPFEGRSIGPQSPPLQDQPLTPAESALVTAGCAQNPEAFKQGTSPAGDPGADAGRQVPAAYAPRYSKTGPQTEEVPMMNPEATGAANDLAAAFTWTNQAAVCKKAANDQ